MKQRLQNFGNFLKNNSSFRNSYFCEYMSNCDLWHTVWYHGQPVEQGDNMFCCSMNTGKI